MESGLLKNQFYRAIFKSITSILLILPVGAMAMMSGMLSASVYKLRQKHSTRDSERPGNVSITWDHLKNFPFPGNQLPLNNLICVCFLTAPPRSFWTLHLKLFYCYNFRRRISIKAVFNLIEFLFRALPSLKTNRESLIWGNRKKSHWNFTINLQSPKNISCATSECPSEKISNLRWI